MIPSVRTRARLNFACRDEANEVALSALPPPHRGEPRIGVVSPDSIFHPGCCRRFAASPCCSGLPWVCFASPTATCCRHFVAKRRTATIFAPTLWSKVPISQAAPLCVRLIRRRVCASIPCRAAGSADRGHTFSPRRSRSWCVYSSPGAGWRIVARWMPLREAGSSRAPQGRLFGQPRPNRWVENHASDRCREPRQDVQCR